MSGEWPYRFEVLDGARLFVDETYQRPLTNFVKRITQEFEPALVGTLVVSAREGDDDHAGRYALVDGQTRAAALRELSEAGKVPAGIPCLVYYGMSRADEARLFARLQKERRGISSYHRFRADLVAGSEEAVAIHRIVTEAGYEIGDGAAVISAVAALEKVFRRSPEMLRRVLAILRAAWGDAHMPNGEVLRGVGYFLAHTPRVDDARLTDHLRGVTPENLKRRASALREGMGHGGGSDKYIAGALEGVYRSSSRRPVPAAAPTPDEPSRNCAVRTCIMVAVPGGDFCDSHDHDDLEEAA